MLILYESVAGYALFNAETDLSFLIKSSNFQDKISNYHFFLKFFKIKYFMPFISIEDVIQDNISLADSKCSLFLQNFLVKISKLGDDKTIIGVTDSKLSADISERLNIKICSDEVVQESTRFIRFHFEKISKKFFFRNFDKVRFNLSHIFFQSKISFNLESLDNMVIQSNFLLEQVDNSLNFLAMNCRELYSWHFPELNKIVKDFYLYSLLIKFIGNKKNLNNKKLNELCALFLNKNIGIKIFQRSKSSIGFAIEKIDMIMIKNLCNCIIGLTEFKYLIYEYLKIKIRKLSPNLSFLIGETLAARLISKTGSLKNLSKYPSSTIQILGSEKALFRSLKKKTKTPKFGILFNSSFIRKIRIKYRAKMSRLLSNKCSIAARIDFFSSFKTNLYGKRFKKQIKEKVKNID
jgi:nucleolar protein 56